MNEVVNLSAFQYDALKEIGNIGIGHATTSLSQMVNDKVDIKFPDLKMIPLLELPPLLTHEEPVVAVIQELKQDIRGYVLLILYKDSAKQLTGLMGCPSEKPDIFDEMETSALEEIGNVMNGSYVMALSNFLGISLNMSPPFLIFDMADSIINQIVGMMSEEVDSVLYLSTEFTIGSKKLDGKMVIFTNPLSLSKILGCLDGMV